MFTENQSGRSMIEMLGVLAIVGVLSVGGIAGYTKAMWQYKINKDIEIITQIVTNTQTLFASQSGECKYTGGSYECDAEGFCDCGNSSQFPTKLVLPQENSDDWEHLSPSGARIGVYWTAIYSEGELENDKTVNSRGFYIYLYNISQKECINLATYNWGSRTNGLIAYSVGEDVVADVQYNPDATYNCQGKIGDNIGLYSVSGALACPGGSVVGVPMPVSVAAEACNKCGDGCWMSFIFE